VAWATSSPPESPNPLCRWTTKAVCPSSGSLAVASKRPRSSGFSGKVIFEIGGHGGRHDRYGPRITGIGRKIGKAGTWVGRLLYHRRRCLSIGLEGRRALFRETHHKNPILLSPFRLDCGKISRGYAETSGADMTGADRCGHGGFLWRGGRVRGGMMKRGILRDPILDSALVHSSSNTPARICIKASVAEMSSRSTP